MAVMNDVWIKQFGISGFINPFILDQINPASYDLCLSSSVIELNSGLTLDIGDKLLINPGKAYLASTLEYLKFPNNICGTLYLKSSLARQGLDHALAGWIDPGFEGNLTLELHAHRKIALYPWQRVVQVVFQSLDAPSAKPYSGRYQGQTGPTRAR